MRSLLTSGCVVCHSVHAVCKVQQLGRGGYVICGCLRMQTTHQQAAGNIARRYNLLDVALESNEEAITALIRWLLAFFGPFMVALPSQLHFGSMGRLGVDSTVDDVDMLQRRAPLLGMSESDRLGLVHESNSAMQVCVRGAVYLCPLCP